MNKQIYFSTKVNPKAHEGAQLKLKTWPPIASKVVRLRALFYILEQTI